MNWTLICYALAIAILFGFAAGISVAEASLGHRERALAKGRRETSRL